MNESYHGFNMKTHSCCAFEIDPDAQKFHKRLMEGDGSYLFHTCAQAHGRERVQRISAHFKLVVTCHMSSSMGNLRHLFEGLRKECLALKPLSLKV